MKDEQWLTEKHYLVCPKGVMYKQMKVLSQAHVFFSGFKAATAADTMIGNPFMCMGMLAVAAPPVSTLQSAAVGMLAFPNAGIPRIGIPPQLLMLASGPGTAKCAACSSTRKWINTSPNMSVNNNHGLIVGKSVLVCPSEGVAVQAVETFWEAMMTSKRFRAGHIALFASGMLAGRGLGAMGRPSSPSYSLDAVLNRLSRATNGLTTSSTMPGKSQEQMGNQQLQRSGQELMIAMVSARGATLASS